MRIFLDASIWLAALGRPEGGAAHLLELAQAGGLVPLTSAAVLQEARRNAGKGGSTPADLEALVLRVRPLLVAIRATDLAPWSAVAEKDRHVIAGAVLGHAEFLVTFDRKHLDNPTTRSLVPLAIGSPGACLQASRKRGDLP